MMKKTHYILISLAISMVLLLTSCTFKLKNNDNYKTSGELAEEVQNEIMECFINKDKDTLKSLLSKSTIENYPIDEQIDEAFSLFDGEIVSYDEPFTSTGGPFGRQYYGAKTEDIITDKGTEYKIAFTGWVRNDEKPEEVGICGIKVIDRTSDYDRSKSKRENGILYIGEEF